MLQLDGSIWLLLSARKQAQGAPAGAKSEEAGNGNEASEVPWAGFGIQEINTNTIP